MNSVRRGERSASALGQGFASHRTASEYGGQNLSHSFRAMSARASPELGSQYMSFSPSPSFQSQSQLHVNQSSSRPFVSPIARSNSSVHMAQRKPVDESHALTGNSEAQRLFLVLEELTQALKICPLIMPDLLLSSSQIMTQAPEFCADEWDDHIHSCKEIQRITVASKTLHPRGTSDKSMRVDRNKALDESEKKIFRRFRHTTRDLCRAFINNPEEAQATLDTLRQLQTMRSSSTQPGESLVHLSEQIMDLRSVCFQRLTTTYEEDEMQYLKIQDANNRLDQLRTEIAILQQEYNKRKEERQEKLDQRLRTVASMRDELAQIETRVQINKANQDRTVTSNHDTLAIKSVQTDIQSLNIELAATESQAQQHIIQYRRAVEASKRELQAIIQKYDKDMIEKQSMIDKLSAEVSDQQKDLDTLEFDLEELHDICKSLEREEWLINLSKDEAGLRKVVLIQRWWRYQLHRKQTALLHKKSKKKKNKGKSGLNTAPNNQGGAAGGGKKNPNLNRINAQGKKPSSSTLQVPNAASTPTAQPPQSTPPDRQGDRSNIQSGGSSFVTSGGQISPRSQTPSPDPTNIAALNRAKPKPMMPPIITPQFGQ